mmetsp:Transcript_47663/g.153304  ORF Transcript_47663/g.153304 Transcript_47663/m.153304 type:complete len:204 (+) Transcript_47663:1098-1709(+)
MLRPRRPLCRLGQPEASNQGVRRGAYVQAPCRRPAPPKLVSPSAAQMLPALPSSRAPPLPPGGQPPPHPPPHLHYQRRRSQRPAGNWRPASAPPALIGPPTGVVEQQRARPGAPRRLRSCSAGPPGQRPWRPLCQRFFGRRGPRRGTSRVRHRRRSRTTSPPHPCRGLPHGVFAPGHQHANASNRKQRLRRTPPLQGRAQGLE